MNMWNDLIGQGKDLTLAQMCTRAFIIFLLAYVLIRISGRRSFGQHSPLDNIIVILLGAILSRAVVGASPFIPVVAASVVVVLLHRLLGWLISNYPKFGEIAEGQKIKLYEDGVFLDSNMRKSLICKEDLLHALRKQMHSADLNSVDKIYMERNGEISILKRPVD